MHESPRWLEAQAAEANGGEGGPARGRWRDLFTRQHIGSMAFLSGMSLFWNLWAGTTGFFFPYILRTVGNQPQALSVPGQALSFLSSRTSIFFTLLTQYDRGDTPLVVRFVGS